MSVDAARPEAAASPWAILLLGLAATTLALFATGRYGVMSYSDSVRYLSIARSLAHGEGFRNNVGDYDVLLGPIYPLVLSLGIRMHVDAMAFARVLHAVLYGATIGLVGVWLRDSGCSRVGWWCGALFALTSSVLFAQGTTELTDMLFIFFTALALVTFDRCLDEDGSWRWLLASGIATGLAAATRYLGVSLVIVGCALLLMPRRAPPLRRLRETVLWGLAASVPLWVWLARNYAVAGTLFGGARLEPGFTAPTFIGRTFAAIGDWWLPDRIPIMPRATFGALVLCMIVATCIASLWTRRRDLAGDRLWVSARTASMFWLAYTAAMVAYCVQSWATDYPERYMVPAVVPMAMLIGVWVTLATRVPRPMPRQLGFIVPAIALLSLVWPARLLEGSAMYLRGHGGGYAGDRWRTSPLMAYLRDHPPSGRLYSNEPNAIYMLTPLRDLRWVPEHDAPGAWITADSALRKFRGSMTAGDTARAVMFSPIQDALAGYRYSTGQLQSVFDVTSEHVESDGAMLVLVPKAAGARP